MKKKYHISNGLLWISSEDYVDNIIKEDQSIWGLKSLLNSRYTIHMFRWNKCLIFSCKKLIHNFFQYHSSVFVLLDGFHDRKYISYYVITSCSTLTLNIFLVSTHKQNKIKQLSLNNLSVNRYIMRQTVLIILECIWFLFNRCNISK